MGWTEQLGPCRPHLDPADVYERIATVATRHAFDEIPPRRTVEDRLLLGYRRWDRLRRRVRQRLLPTDRIVAAPPARV